MFDGPDTINWLVEDGGNAYHIYRGSMTTLRNSGKYTQAVFPAIPERFCDYPAASLPFVDAFAPATPGQVAFYLVTRREAAFKGTLGQDSSGVLRPNDFPCP